MKDMDDLLNDVLSALLLAESYIQYVKEFSEKLHKEADGIPSVYASIENMIFDVKLCQEKRSKALEALNMLTRESQKLGRYDEHTCIVDNYMKNVSDKDKSKPIFISCPCPRCSPVSC